MVLCMYESNELDCSFQRMISFPGTYMTHGTHPYTGCLIEPMRLSVGVGSLQGRMTIQWKGYLLINEQKLGCV
jgi:hypothetical protein